MSSILPSSCDWLSGWLIVGVTRWAITASVLLFEGCGYWHWIFKVVLDLYNDGSYGTQTKVQHIVVLCIERPSWKPQLPISKSWVSPDRDVTSLAPNLWRILSTPHSTLHVFEWGPRARNVNPSTLKILHSKTWIWVWSFKCGVPSNSHKFGLWPHTYNGY